MAKKKTTKRAKKKVVKKRTTAARATAARSTGKTQQRKKQTKKQSKKTTKKASSARPRATAKSPGIEGQTPLRVHREIGAKSIAMPRGTSAPTAVASLRRGRRIDVTPAPHGALKLPVKAATDRPIRPTRIRVRGLPGKG